MGDAGNYRKATRQLRRRPVNVRTEHPSFQFARTNELLTAIFTALFFGIIIGTALGMYLSFVPTPIDGFLHPIFEALRWV